MRKKNYKNYAFLFLFLGVLLGACFFFFEEDDLNYIGSASKTGISIPKTEEKVLNLSLLLIIELINLIFVVYLYFRK